MAEYRWRNWAGAAGEVAVADYADARLKRYNSRYANSQIVDAAVIALDILGYGDRSPFMTGAIDGAADAAVGQLVSGFVRSRMAAGGATPPPPPAATQAAPAGGAPAAAPNAFTGVPAAGGSAAFLQPTSGY